MDFSVSPPESPQQRNISPTFASEEQDNPPSKQPRLSIDELVPIVKPVPMSDPITTRKQIRGTLTSSPLSSPVSSPVPSRLISSVAVSRRHTFAEQGYPRSRLGEFTPKSRLGQTFLPYQSPILEHARLPPSPPSSQYDPDSVPSGFLAQYSLSSRNSSPSSLSLSPSSISLAPSYVPSQEADAHATSHLTISNVSNNPHIKALIAENHSISLHNKTLLEELEQNYNRILSTSVEMERMKVELLELEEENIGYRRLIEMSSQRMSE
eukprot:c8655_g2_i2.p1 GENE.c8655_g2_i2~~c8655_g2_i2.p1  ORF type:complete len:266 (-),score=73.55 c8655_g2_i2:456-1253(-)